MGFRTKGCTPGPTPTTETGFSSQGAETPTSPSLLPPTSLHSQPPASGPLSKNISSAMAPHQHPPPDQLSLQAQERLSHQRCVWKSWTETASLLRVDLWKELCVFVFFLRSQTSTLCISLHLSLSRISVLRPGARAPGVTTWLCPDREVHLHIHWALGRIK